ncbi:hypothetical protein L6452_43747 [Arctium lappa]|uniref:Uncharacterized protein n=1 Tax=Arctium lappa TaxID=4217 RepID=A0ACB8XDC7_ARCLA|nr:hypothetical protein L6452_43747 [Arctium lappa]
MQASGSTGTGKKKVRGAYYGASIEKEIAMNRGTGVTRLEVLFDPITGKAIDKYGKWFNNFTAHLVRENVSPEFFFWKNVPQTDIEVIYQKLSCFHPPIYFPNVTLQTKIDSDEASLVN